MKTSSRKFLSLFLAVIMMISVIPLTGMTTLAADGDIGIDGDFEYSVLSEEERTCEITEYNGTATELTIPSQLDGYAVTRIGNGAFRDCISLASIAIPDSVTSIGCYAFSNTAYYNDESNWENDVLYIGNHLIEAKRTISGEYSIKEGTKTIADEAFYGRTSLTSITIPESITKIGYGTFRYCISLTSIEIPNSVTSIDSSAFDYTAYYNDESNWENGVLYIGKHLIKAKDTLSGEYIIKDGTVCIADSAFENCTSLTSVTIGNGVTSIGDFAFEHCVSLASITIPDSVAIPNGVTSIGDEAFRHCTSLTSVTIPDSVTSIGYYAFADCISLTSVTIPDSVTWIDYAAFCGCPALQSISVSVDNKNYCDIDGVLFNKTATGLICCPAGKSGDYTIPDSVTSIKGEAFYFCASLTSITIPDSVTNIGRAAFGDCKSLTSINIPDGVTSIGDGTFEYCKSLTSINIPDGVTSIGDEAFRDCESLTSINIPDSVTSIGDMALYYCTSLTSITIPNNVTSIGVIAFAHCDNLTIYGYSGSYAETYANENSVPFTAIDALINTENNISVTFPNEDMRESTVSLNVDKISATENAITYDIKLTENGTEIQPESSVTVKIPVPSTMNGVNCKVYREETDGTKTDMKAVYKDGFMVFTTDHFSTYILQQEP